MPPSIIPARDVEVLVRRPFPHPVTSLAPPSAPRTSAEVHRTPPRTCPPAGGVPTVERVTGAVPEPLPGWLTGARRITVLSGAGVSTDSGIPDYRGPNGVWTRDPDAEKLVTLSYYVGDPAIRRRAWRMRAELRAGDVHPNAGHHALAALEAQGRLRALLTQNVDGLHQAAGSAPERVLELHGTVHAVECLSCGDRTSMDSALARLDAGEDDPACLVCGGILKSATVSFGQALDGRVLDAAARAAGDCDVFLAVGTSLVVYPRS